jgi:hypothetical protein
VSCNGVVKYRFVVLREGKVRFGTVMCGKGNDQQRTVGFREGKVG